MEFPVPDGAQTNRRSIAEKHRFLTFAFAVVVMFPVGAVMSRDVSNGVFALLATFVCSYALVVVFIFVLRGRFMKRFSRSGLALQHTSRPLQAKAQNWLDHFAAQGFAVTDIVVVASDDGVVFSQPVAIMRHLATGDTAVIAAQGGQIRTLLSDGRWLVTATGKVVSHSSQLVQPAVEGTAAGALATHGDGLAVLARLGVRRAAQPPALDVALHAEQMEQEALRAYLSDPSRRFRATSLIETGTPLSQQDLGNLAILR